MKCLCEFHKCMDGIAEALQALGKHLELRVVEN
jgi:hypothetical protein